MEEDRKCIVCVTGGNGYLASWLIKRLLQHGYYVHATVRFHPSGKKDLSFLTSLPGASEKLRIFNADLDEPDSFDAAIEGCTGVFHVAHPMDFGGREIDETTNERAIKGSLGVLKACLKSKTVTRVVYTSSSSAVFWNEETDDPILDENAWSDVNLIKSCKPYAAPYFICKTLTEKAVLEFAKDHGIDLVSVIPSLITGPFLGETMPGSISAALSMILGTQETYSEFLVQTSMVHIDDVARAHIFLFEHPDAKGRYICSSKDITIHEMYEFLSTKYPEFQLPTQDFIKGVQGYKQKGLSPKKLLDTGFKFQNGLDDMFDGAIQCCKEKGLLCRSHSNRTSQNYNK